jgi:hypothetical protein
VKSSIAELEADLGRLLSLVADANRVNILTSGQLRQSIAESHRDEEQDQREHGGQSAGVYWDLVMADWSYDEPAVFAVATWRETTLTISAGAADRARVLEVCDRFTLAEVEEMAAAMESEFNVSRNGVLTVSRGLGEYWTATVAIP